MVKHEESFIIEMLVFSVLKRHTQISNVYLILQIAREYRRVEEMKKDPFNFTGTDELHIQQMHTRLRHQLKE